MSLERVQKAKIATQAVFLVCGLALSSWAPMVPFAKERLSLNESDLGLLLLLLGAGAILMMPVTGFLSHKFGTRIIIFVSGLMAAALLPLLLLVDHVWAMAVLLFLFGASVGAIDVAMNTHGVFVQNQLSKPVMSSLHGLFSVGGLLGSLGLGLLIEAGLRPMFAAIFIACILVLILISQFGSLFSKALEQPDMATLSDRNPEKARSYGWLHKTILFLGGACFIVFLAEGAMLDWSALLLTENRGVSAGLSGIGYAVFSVAMAVMRLTGDRLVTRLSEKTVVVGGTILAAAGILIAANAGSLGLTLAGFVLLGIGSANIVPVFFSEAGRLKAVPSAIAIPAVSTIGYAGQLAGPALIGFVAHQYSLPLAISIIGVLLLIVACSYALRKTT